MSMFKKAVLLLLCFVIFSCGKTYKSTQTRKDLLFEGVECLVVLPFDSKVTASGEWPGRILATLLGSKIASTKKFRVLEWNELDVILSSQNITMPKSIDRDFAVRLGEVLNVHGVVYGKVTEYDYKKGKQGQDSIPVVGIITRVLSVKAKRDIFTGTYARSSYDVIDLRRETLSEVAIKVADDFVKDLTKNIGDRKLDYKNICWSSVISLDIDGDGILNFADACPTEKESFEGILDNDGCPEPEIAAGDFRSLVELKGNRIVYRGNIAYVDKEATLLPVSAPILKGVATLIKEHPEIRSVTIEGFSDDMGKEKFTEEFSFKRAMSVKYFLMREGIPSDRLSAIGYEKVKSWRRSLIKEIEFSVMR